MGLFEDMTAANPASGCNSRYLSSWHSAGQRLARRVRINFSGGLDERKRRMHSGCFARERSVHVDGTTSPMVLASNFLGMGLALTNALHVLPYAFQRVFIAGLGLFGDIVCAQPSNPIRDTARPRLAMSYDLGNPAQTQPPMQTLARDAAGRSPTGLLQLAANAIANQPTLRVAAAHAGVDQERVEQARSAMRLNLSGTLAYQQEFERGGTPTPFRNQAAGD